MNIEKYKERLEQYPIKRLEAIAKREFNRSIVLRDLFRKPNGDLIAKCISCRREKIINCSYDLKDFVAGHYFKSDRFESVRFNRANLSCQCAQYCNVRMSGNESKYEINLIKKIGQQEFDNLKFRANQVKKLTYRDYINIILESREMTRIRQRELKIKFY